MERWRVMTVWLSLRGPSYGATSQIGVGGFTPPELRASRSFLCSRAFACLAIAGLSFQPFKDVERPGSILPPFKRASWTRTALCRDDSRLPMGIAPFFILPVSTTRYPPRLVTCLSLVRRPECSDTFAIASAMRAIPSSRTSVARAVHRTEAPPVLMPTETNGF